MTWIVNYTGHELSFVNGWKLPSDYQARVSSKMRQVDSVHGIPILEVTERNVRNLPKPVHDTFYVVSGIVAAAAGRPDVLCPGRVERDEFGEVICAKALIRLVGM